MRRFVVFLICFAILFSLCACDPDKPQGSIGNGTDAMTDSTDEASDSTSDGTAETNGPTLGGTDLPIYRVEDEFGFLGQTTFSRVEKTDDPSKLRYSILGLDGNVLFTEERDQSLRVIADPDYRRSSFVKISYCNEAGVRVTKYYDAVANRVSAEYTDVLEAEDGIVAYRKTDGNRVRVIVESLFDDSIYKEYTLDPKDAEATSCVARISRGNLYLRLEKTTVLPIYDAGYDYFGSYGAIIELIDEIRIISYYCGEDADYASILGVTDARELDLLDLFLESFQADGFYAYALRDLNCDGVFELILFAAKRESISAIFSMVDGKPILLGHYSGSTYCYVDHNGVIYVCERDFYGDISRNYYRIAEDGASLELLAAVAIDYSAPPTGGGYLADYYRVENGARIPITRDEYYGICGAYLYPSFNLLQYCARLDYHSGSDAARQVDAKNALLMALKNQSKVFDHATDRFCFLSEYVLAEQAGPLAEVDGLSYTFLDLDCDAVGELVISDGDATLILRYEEGAVSLYRYALPTEKLYDNGTFDSSPNGQTAVKQASRLVFVDGEVLTRTAWRTVNDGAANAEYYWRGRRVKKTSFAEYLEKYPYESAAFLPLSIPLEVKISPEQAWEIANAYWGEADGRTDGAAGTTLVSCVKLLDRFDIPLGYYRVVLLCEHHRHSNETCSMSYVGFWQDVLVNMHTGECTPCRPLYEGK